MSKQDRVYARTPTDLERKYDLGGDFAEIRGLVSDAQRAAEEARKAIDELDEILGQEVPNMISSALASSPSIAGGKFYNLAQDTWLEIGNADGYFGLVLTNVAQSGVGQNIFSVYDGELGYTSFGGKNGHTFLKTDGAAKTSFPQGTWDFSNATVIGLPVAGS